MKSLFYIFTIFFALGLCAAEKSKIYFLYGKRSHGPGEHEFKAGANLLANHLNKQTALPIEAKAIFAWPKDEAILNDAAAVIIYCDAMSVTGKGLDSGKLQDLAKKGVGIMMMHYAVHPNTHWGEKFFIPGIGGYFCNGKSANPHWIADLRIKKEHPISNGVGAIRALDEWYFALKFHKNHIPLGVAKFDKTQLNRINNLWTKEAYESEGKDVTLLWGVEREGGGRGAGFTGGHYHRNWGIDNFRKATLNTIVWVAGLEVPKGGVPTAAVTEDELNENLDDYGKRKIKRIKIPTEADYAKRGEFFSVEEFKKRKALAHKKKMEREKKKKEAAKKK